MIKNSDSRVESIVSAIKDGAVAATPPTQVIISNAQGSAVRELVAPILDPDGTIKPRFNELLKSSAWTLEREAKTAREAAVKESDDRHSVLKQAIAARQDELAVFVDSGVRRDLLDKPFLIWSTVGLDITSEIQPGASWAKFNVDTRNSMDENLTFWYLWENPSDQHAVLDVHGYLIANGFAYVQSEGGFLAGYRNSNVQLSAHLRLLQWWESPATEPLEQDSQQQIALTVGISTGGYLDDAASAVAQLYRGYDLSYNLFVVPPRATVVFQVAFRVRTSVSHGQAQVDFDSGAFQITCPYLLLITLS